MWLVDPSGEVQTRFLKSSGIKELDDIARETVKDYKFKPIEDPQSGKYRLVTAKYDFP
jgi:outer membrane biosynthesis protein TonB